MSTLAIIAGGGELPRAVARSARGSGRDVFVVGLRGAADPEIAEFPHDWISLGEAGRLFRLLRAHGCEDVLFAGRVARPKLSELKVDTKGVLLLPRVIAATRAGDDALLRALMDIIAGEGFRSVGVADAAPGLVAPEGVLGRAKPDAEHENDIALGVKVVRRLGALDVGQSAVVCAGLVLAVEAAEGTDAMLERVAAMRESGRIALPTGTGVLVKAPKRGQDRRFDLPSIGPDTVARAAKAGLAGIAVIAGATIVAEPQRLIEAADRVGLFVTGCRDAGAAE
jgi:UDP-2,3-diacylglucosamine hydrolase